MHLYHNSYDVLNMTLYVPGTMPGASHTFAHLIQPTSCEDGRWCAIHGVSRVQDAPLWTWTAKSVGEVSLARFLVSAPAVVCSFLFFPSQKHVFNIKARPTSH